MDECQLKDTIIKNRRTLCGLEVILKKGQKCFKGFILEGFLVSIILGFAGAEGGSSGGNGSFINSQGNIDNFPDGEAAIGYLILVLVIVGIVLLFGFAFRIFRISP